MGGMGGQNGGNTPDMNNQNGGNSSDMNGQNNGGFGGGRR